MAVNNIFGASSIDDLADNVLSGVDDFMLTVEKMQKRKVASNVQLVVQALKKIESDLQDKYDGVTTVIEKRVSTIKDGRDGINGRDGRDGKDGRPGKDGMPGARGKDGAPGQDGADGMDGVSVTDARIDFDGSLIIVLSSGREINVGEVVTPDLAERIKVITNGGGTSQGVLDTLASLQAQINLLSSALVYAGTWNASTNTPTLASGVGTSNTFYIVSVAGTTTLNGISNWGVGDWAIFNGTVWQRVEGGAEGNFTNLSVSGTTTLSGGTANGVAYLNGSKVVTTGSSLAFDGTNLALGGSSPSTSSGYSKMRMNGSTGSLLELTSNGTQVLLIQADGAAAGAKIVTAFNGSSPPLILGVNNLTEVLLTNDGMGLGTGITAVTSGYKLDVQAAKALTLLKSTTGTNEVFHRINNTGGNFTLGIDSAGGAQTGTGYASYLWSTANTPLVLGTNNAAVATFSAAGNLTLNTGTFTYSAGTANGVAYLNGSKVLTTGSALTFDGTNFNAPQSVISGSIATLYGNTFSAGNSQTWLTNNASASDTYRTSDTAQRYRMLTGVGFTWETAASGTAGAGISWSEQMRLTSTGLGIGTSSPSRKLTVFGSDSVPFFNVNGYDVASWTGATLDFGGMTAAQWNTLRFFTSGSERARITSGGNFGIGQTSPQTALGFANAATISWGTTNYPFISGDQPNNTLTFGTQATERARIDSSGNLLVGTTSGAFNTRMLVSQPTSSVNVLALWNEATTGDNQLVQFFTDTGAGRGSITYNRAGGLVAYNTTSDYRAKDIIGPVQDPGATIDALTVYEGKMKGATQSRPMLVAHEAQAHAPYAVSGVKDEVNEDGTPKFQQMDVSSLVPLLLAEIQSLRARVAQLEQGA